jgi:hypothetical protein
MFGGVTVASLYVKAAKIANSMPILQIVQIAKSTSYVESVRWGRTNPSSSATQIYARSSGFAA